MTEPVLVTQPVGNDNKRVKKIAIAGLVLLLVIFVLPKVLGGGGGSDEAEEFPPPSSVPTTAPAKRGDVETLGAYGTKNPFTPLIEVASESTDAPQPVADVVGPGADPTFDVFPVDDGSSVDPGAPLEPTSPSSPTTPTTAPPRPTHRLSLLEVYRDHAGAVAARVRVDDTVMETAVGQDFGGSYRTISLDRDKGCGVFLFGDRRLTLCEGQEVIT
jgi:hypothetical protein